ncbi:hypothetical protein R1flu_009404 [Riccia fluitans]|uniref:Uncharacterized protein n=1 Tax=Riccia fluitans TaxID=41844 RepID=A0ABD1Z202_9MARC
MTKSEESTGRVHPQLKQGKHKAAYLEERPQLPMALGFARVSTSLEVCVCTVYHITSLFDLWKVARRTDD